MLTYNLRPTAIKLALDTLTTYWTRNGNPCYSNWTAKREFNRQIRSDTFTNKLSTLIPTELKKNYAHVFEHPHEPAEILETDAGMMRTSAKYSCQNAAEYHLKLPAIYQYYWGLVRFLHHDPGRYSSFGGLGETAKYTVGRSMYETDSVPAHWVELCNDASLVEVRRFWLKMRRIVTNCREFRPILGNFWLKNWRVFDQMGYPPLRCSKALFQVRILQFIRILVRF